jgi:hypothetical protein
MEYVPGLDLKHLLRRLTADERGMDAAVALHVTREIAQALDYAHRRVDSIGNLLGLVHGDVTPQNILLSREGEVKLADFGIARALGTLAPGNQLRGGTPGFVAPEGERGHIDHRTDIYALGATLYISLGGTSPERDGINLRGLHRRRPEIAEDLLALVSRATAANPADRFQTAADFEQALAFQLARRFPTFTPSTLASLVRTYASEVPSPNEKNVATRLTSVTGSDAVTLMEAFNVETPHSVASESAPRPGTRRLEQPRTRAFFWVGLAGAAAAFFAAFWPKLQSMVPVVQAPPRASVLAQAPVGTSAIAKEETSRIAKEEAAPRAATEETPHEPQAPPSPPHTTRTVRKGVGYMTVTSTPWGAVFVDGRRVSDWTPAYRVAVAAGTHTVTVFSPKRGSYSPPKKVVVRPAELATLGFEW